VIKRQFFISGEMPHNDGKGSYSFSYAQYSVTSFFPDIDFSFKEGLKILRTNFENKNLYNSINVKAFNKC